MPTYDLELVLRDIDPLAGHSREVAVAIDADALKDGIHKDRVRVVTFEDSAHSRYGRDDRKCVEDLAFSLPPHIPKTRKGERLFVLWVKPNGNLAVSFSAPFIVATGWNKTTIALY